MTATIYEFPKGRPAVILAYSSDAKDAPPDKDLARQRQRLVGRWCRHALLPNRCGFVDSVERAGDKILARMSKGNRAHDFYRAEHIDPAAGTSTPPNGGSAA